MRDPTLILRGLAFEGAGRASAQVVFERGLNVICGASDTGKSFVAESIDFMLGGKDTPADIPERVGYDEASLVLELPQEAKTYRLERSTTGGDFRRVEYDDPAVKAITLHAKHQQGRADTLSAWLLSTMGLTGKRIRTNAQGELRTLSFRDIARLVILQQGEISSKTSPYLTGQHVSRTAEFSALKLVLTGADDSAVVRAKIQPDGETSAAKIEVLNSLIEQLRSEVVAADGTADDLEAQLEKLQSTMSLANLALRHAQQQLDDRMSARREAYQNLELASARQEEIGNLLARFDLLEKHYSVDLQRLAAIKEAGHFIAHLPTGPCPLCGAAPYQQHLDSKCDANVVSVADAAEGEQKKVRRLVGDLATTVAELRAEGQRLNANAEVFASRARQLDQDIRETLSPSVGDLRGEYSSLVEKASEIRRNLNTFRRITDLEERKATLIARPEPTATSKSHVAVDISKSVTHALSLVVERILATWNFPGATRVSFDEATIDFVCDGKPRGSFGAGFRAIISAAAAVGLLEYCLEHDRPHPGFLVLESPLLAYWKPESSADNLKGSDLKDRFYQYLEAQHCRNQVIVIENEHPPANLTLGSRLTVFTRNPKEGRYGFFPVAQ